MDLLYVALRVVSVFGGLPACPVSAVADRGGVGADFDGSVGVCLSVVVQAALVLASAVAIPLCDVLGYIESGDHKRTFEKMGMTRTEIFCIVGNVLVQLCFMGLTMIVVVWKRKDLLSYQLDATKIWRLCERSSVKKGRRRAVLVLLLDGFLVWVGLMLVFQANRLMLFPGRLSTGLRLAISAMFTVTYVCSVTSPFSASLHACASLGMRAEASGLDGLAERATQAADRLAESESKGKGDSWAKQMIRAISIESNGMEKSREFLDTSTVRNITPTDSSRRNSRHFGEDESEREVGPKLYDIVSEGEELISFIRERCGGVGLGEVLYLAYVQSFVTFVVSAVFASSMVINVAEKYENDGSNSTSTSDSDFIEERDTVMLLFGIAATVQLLLSALRIRDFTERGHEIKVSLDTARRALKRLRLAARCCDGFSDERSRLHLDDLLEELSTCEGVTPRDTFVVGRASTVSLMAIATTYYVVLLQFRVGESPYSSVT